MSNILNFPADEIHYITGNASKGEPPIVGVKCKGISMQFNCDLHNILLGDVEIKREELIAFIVATNIDTDFIEGRIKTDEDVTMYAVSEIDNQGRIEEIKVFDNINEAHELKMALDDSSSFSATKVQHQILAHKYVCGYRV